MSNYLLFILSQEEVSAFLLFAKLSLVTSSPVYLSCFYFFFTYIFTRLRELLGRFYKAIALIKRSGESAFSRCEKNMRQSLTFSILAHFVNYQTFSLRGLWSAPYDLCG